MDMLGEVKKLVDANGDGKLSVEDIEALKTKFPDQAGLLDQAKSLADSNEDGKVDLSDLQNLNLGNLDMKGLADKFGGLFGK